MFVINIEIEPNPGTEQAEEAGGAYAVCWVDFQLQDGAEHLARFYIEQSGWTTKSIKSVEWVNEGYYDTGYEEEEKNTLKQYYAEAVEDGICLVYHQWPLDAEDADEEDV